MDNIKQNNQEPDLTQLVKGLQKEDSHYLALINTLSWFNWILSPLYLLIFLFDTNFGHPEIDEVGNLFISLGFMAFALLFRSLKKEYKSVDYGVSTMEMLRKAANRYSLWQAKTYLAIIPALLISAGLSFIEEKIFSFDDQAKRILAAFGISLIILIFSSLIGYFIWRKSQKPLRDKALEILKEFEE